MKYLILILLFVSPLNAKQKKDSLKNKNLKREFNFNDMNLVGNYKKSFGSNIVVEDEKDLDELLGVRKNFKDRVKVESKRNSL